MFEDANNLYIAVEYVEGDSIFENIVANGKMSARQAAKALGELCGGIVHIHACGVAHRDLKAENLLLTANRQIKVPSVSRRFIGRLRLRLRLRLPLHALRRIQIADFGLSKNLPEESNLCKTSCGSPHYTAPEVPSCGQSSV